MDNSRKRYRSSKALDTFLAVLGYPFGRQGRLNYMLTQGCYGSFSKKCRHDVLSLLESGCSLKGKSLGFLRKLTKCSNTLFTAEPPALDGIVERIYDANMLMIEKIGNAEKRCRFDFNSLRSIALSQLGNASKNMLDRTKNLDWGERWYSFSFEAARLIEDSKPNNEYMQFAFAGNAAKIMYENTNDIAWLQRWLDCYKKAAEKSLIYDPSFSMNAHSLAGLAAKGMFHRTDDPKFGEQSYNLFIKSLWLKNRNKMVYFMQDPASYLSEVSKKMFNLEQMMPAKLKWAARWFHFDKKLGDIMLKKGRKDDAANSYSYASDACSKIFSIRRDKKWLSNKFELSDLAAKMMLDIDREKASYFLGFAGTAAKEMFMLTGEVDWALKSYELQRKSAEMIEVKDSMHSAYTFCFAGEAALSMFTLTKDITWAEKAYELYNHTLELLEKPGNSANIKYIVNVHFYAGDSARQISLSRKGDEEWLKKQFFHMNEAYEMGASMEMKKSYIACYTAACSLSMLADINHDLPMKVKSAELFRAYVSFYENHPHPKIQEKVQKARRTIEYVARIVENHNKNEKAKAGNAAASQSAAQCIDGKLGGNAAEKTVEKVKYSGRGADQDISPERAGETAYESSTEKLGSIINLAKFKS